MIGPDEIARLLIASYRQFSDSGEPIHVRSYLDPVAVESLPRPWLVTDASFRVALFDWPQLQYFTEPELAQSAQAHLRRTRLYESIHCREESEWQVQVARAIQAVIGHTVMVSAYQSTPRDQTLPRHIDAWFNQVLQLEGTKRWTFDTGSVVLNPGDLLVVPTGAGHEVKAESDSLHVSFEVVDQAVVDGYLTTTTDSSPT